MSKTLRRSALYLPASNAKAIAKASTLPCDVVILDLEDAVAPAAKHLARAQAIEAIRSSAFGDRDVVLRVNGVGTEWHREDMAAGRDAAPDAILVPKVDHATDVAALHAGMSSHPARIELWAMIETCRAIGNLFGITATAADTRLTTLVVGLNDLAKEMRAQTVPGRQPMQMALATIVTAARADGLDALDAVFNDLEDAAGFEDDCRQGVAFGFDGKTLIHPRQIGVCNRVFSPSESEVDWARAVVQAYSLPENANVSALRVDGRLAERLHLQQSIETVARHERIVGSGLD